MWHHGAGAAITGQGGFGRDSGTSNHRFRPSGRGRDNNTYHQRDIMDPAPLVDLEHYMERALKEWGIDPENKSDEHQAFYDQHMKFVRAIRRGNVDRQPANQLESLPLDLLEAVREVMRQEFVSTCKYDRLKVINDRLQEQFPEVSSFQPPFRFNRESRAYELTSSYERLGILPEHVANPFSRFHPSRRLALEVLRKDYVDEGGSAWGVVIRALVGSVACHNAKCVHCASEALQWNAYNLDIDFRYWKKLVCRDCKSVYEIKSAVNKDAVERKFCGMVYNGTFLSAYHAVQCEIRRGKQFLVVLCEETEMVDGQECWPVFYATVDQVYPTLKARSFCHTDKPKVYSKFTVYASDTLSDNLWRHVPVVDEDWKAVAASIIDSLDVSEWKRVR
jgi:hypothetical protein